MPTKKKKAQKHVHKTPLATREVERKAPAWMIPSILVLAFLVYIPVLNAGFVNWDDADYVNDNLLIRDFANFPALITTPLQGNYHPLTMISLAFNYAISGMEAWSYHLLNLLLHLANTYLVFRLVQLLGKKNIILSFTTAVLFAIHPMHVESVAWVSERKDVLYGFFFLLGLISYTKYVDTGSKKQYGWSALFFICSLLSKPAAVVFPLALFCIDVLRKRKINWKMVAEKMPFLVLAFMIGLLTYLAQKEKGAMGGYIFPVQTKVLMGFYGIMMYTLKMFFPFKLAALYPYPAINEPLPTPYFISPLFFIALVALVYFTWKKNRVVAFGILFFLVNLILVLQFLPVGSAVIADRYTYIPYIGLFYIIGWLVSLFAKNNEKKAYVLLSPVILLFSILSFIQSGVWKDGAHLWDQAISAQPSANAYNLRASLLRQEKNYPLALKYYNKAVSMNAILQEAYANRGNIYFDLGKPDSAYADYRTALNIKPDFYSACDNMGALMATRGQYDSALFYLNKALSIQPDYKPSFRNRGLVYLELNRHEEAIKDFRRFLQYQNNDADIYNTIGICYRLMNHYNEAVKVIDTAILIRQDPHFYLNRSYAWFGLKNMEQAKKDALVAQRAALPLDQGYLKSLGIQ